MLKIKAIRPELLTLLASGFFLLAFNQALWQHLLQITSADGSGWLLRGAFVMLVLAVFNLVLTLLAFRWGWFRRCCVACLCRSSPRTDS